MLNGKSRLWGYYYFCRMLPIVKYEAIVSFVTVDTKSTTNVIFMMIENLQHSK
jgi:hypothetical protein